MERHGIDEREAFDLLRSHSRRTGRKLIDVAEAVTTSHLLLATQRVPAPEDSAPPDLRSDGRGAESLEAAAEENAGPN